MKLLIFEIVFFLFHTKFPFRYFRVPFTARQCQGVCWLVEWDDEIMYKKMTHKTSSDEKTLCFGNVVKEIVNFLARIYAFFCCDRQFNAFNENFFPFLIFLSSTFWHSRRIELWNRQFWDKKAKSWRWRVLSVGAQTEILFNIRIIYQKTENVLFALLKWRRSFISLDCQRTVALLIEQFKSFNYI